MAFARSEYSALVVTFLAGMMGYWCVLAARGASTPPISSTVFPPETSLIAVGGFSPPGFEWGIEILNDDRTPMLFVVSILQDTMGMTEKNAVRVMLDIHQKGGVLLPTSTPEEANRIADLIVSEARAKDHPLVCRAVSATQRNSSGQ
jgi:ATP-dependent Clp protease adapter protein ClpS